ncbi:prepilin-type N-terminal cleavage/methylation domain-containing protein [Ureibacillus sp. Re31]|uniref:ComG operon protein 3 n=1 Tax=Ureibacillus galli TaxID=2762222 RepID=A0ABR8X9V0_9BACL|nr:competence type IV pilus major pilin ComGC [Ureibacillus galli]MBD8026079.1 prepilin-type N-terminal cleavage/methylation domain-containing protein [Ureibacillus galli]
MLKKQDGFTLIEMLIVLFIISILILVTIPNVTKHFSSIDKKGCDAYVKMVQGQVEAYRIDHHTIPTMNELVEKDYINEGETSCPNGADVEIQSDGKVVVKGE